MERLEKEESMEVGLESKVVSAAAAGVVDGIPADFGFAEAMDCPHAASATSPEGDISEPGCSTALGRPGAGAEFC